MSALEYTLILFLFPRPSLICCKTLLLLNLMFAQNVCNLLGMPSYNYVPKQIHPCFLRPVCLQRTILVDSVSISVHRQAVWVVCTTLYRTVVWTQQQCVKGTKHWVYILQPRFVFSHNRFIQFFIKFLVVMNIWGLAD